MTAFSPQLLAQLAATAEILQSQLSEGALRVMLDDLAGYDEAALLAALHRLRMEGGRFTVDAIVSRLPGMWPGAEQAWAEFPKDEASSACVTREAMQAWGVASELDDAVAARMAFKETYIEAVKIARAAGRQPDWIMTLGHDSDLREQAILKGVREQRLGIEKAAAYLPHLEASQIPLIAGSEHPLMLGDESITDEQMQANKQRLAELLSQLRQGTL